MHFLTPLQRRPKRNNTPVMKSTSNIKITVKKSNLHYLTSILIKVKINSDKSC